MKILKPWGHETIYVKNDLYVVKELFIKAGERLSLQYHKDKDETVMLVSGKASISRQPLIFHQHNPNLLPERMTPFQPYQVKPNTVHRIEAEKDTLIVEVSSPQFDDVVRLEDDYGRHEPCTELDFELKFEEDLDLDNIELCAKAAPAGPYGKIIGGVVNTRDGRILKDDDTFDHLQNCDPQTILALIALVRKKND